MVLAAGLGTRLKPWTDSHPKALAPVGGTPVLGLLLDKLEGAGISEIVVNVHHFAGQIVEYLQSRTSGLKISISDESASLLETGGGLAKATPLLINGLDPEDVVLVHNADILSDFDFMATRSFHLNSGRDVTLVTSRRATSRKLIFSQSGILEGWHNTASGLYRPEGFIPTPGMTEHAFSGIYLLNAKALRAVADYATGRNAGKFSIMEWFLSSPEGITIGEWFVPELRLLDIGKPEALSLADSLPESQRWW